MIPTVSRVGCGARVPDIAGPVHRYMESLPGCWAAYGEILAREYGDIAFATAHSLTVDSYAIQHPGQPSPQSVQSVGLHLISLSLVLEHGATTQEATAALRRGSRCKQPFVWLDPPNHRGMITVLDLRAAETPEQHVKCVWEWARAAWAAWSKHHERIDGWIRQLSLLPTVRPNQAMQTCG